MTTRKSVNSLTIDDLRSFSVWEFTNADEDVDETIVRPVEQVPVESLGGCVVGTQVRLANGTEQWAILGNLDVESARRTRHFLTLSINSDGRWFSLARYHDFDVNERGPDALASLLGLSVREVFPISYDVSSYCLGERDALIGRITEEPEERLTRAQIIALAVP